MQNKYIVIDLETTGNSPEKGDEIIQIAAVQIENNEITKRYTSFVQPGIAIPAFIQELTDIDEEMVADAPSISEIIAHVHHMLKGAYFVAHNVQFDLTFLNEAFAQAGLQPFTGRVIDTVEVARIVYPSSDSYQLNDLAIQMGFPHDRPHRADSDAEVTAALFLQMTEKIYSLPEETLQMLSRQSSLLKSNLDFLIERIIVKKQMTVNDLPDSLETYGGLVFTKPNGTNDALSYQAQDATYPVTDEEKTSMFTEALPVFTTRDGQFTMMDAVYDAFLQERHAVIEAGTGIGKSLAYLVPAAYVAHATASRVIVSTHTTLLQEQLLRKEIPLLKKMLPFSPKAVLLKGRAHYISLGKFAQSLRESNDNYDTNITKMQILVWLTETHTGDVDELNLSSGGTLYWNKIKCDETMFFKNSEWRAYDFYERAKAAAKTADIIITNHVLLVTQLQAEQRVIPPTDYLIIDEAHHFAKAAARQVGFKLDYVSIRLLLGKLGTFDQGQLLDQLEQLLHRYALKEKVTCDARTINGQITDLSFEVDQFFGTLQAYVTSGIRNKDKQMNRFSVPFEKENARSVVIAAERYYFILKDIVTSIQNRLDVVHNDCADLSTAEKYQLEKIAIILDEMADTGDTLKQLFLQQSAAYVTWIEMNRRSGHQSIVILGEPLDISLQMGEQLFSKTKSIVLTSATLTVNDSFQYVTEQLGLAPFQPHVLQVASPFNYKEQVQLLIPDDIPEINKVTVDVYVAALAEYIISIAEATKGRLLILFTSHDMLRSTHYLIKESGYLEDYIMIAQGITSGSRTRLMRNFQRFERAILFGTNSFWEGIDIPGEDLSCLVIVRLPFARPDEPIFKAKAQLLKEEGKNPFNKLSLPEAVLRFKQGFGRLIRTEEDRGIIIVFDRRIVTKSYGAAFLQSIPAIPIKTSGINDIVETIHEWL